MFFHGLSSTKLSFGRAGSCRGFSSSLVIMKGGVSFNIASLVLSRVLITLESARWSLLNLPSLFFLQLDVVWRTDLHKKNVIWTSVKKILNYID